MTVRIRVTLLAFLTMTATSSAQTAVVSKEGVLRAAYLASNPAHAVKDPTTGEARGVAIDLARELGRSVGAAVTLLALENPQRVIDAVRKGEADIGFVAYNPERAGPVEFSKPYLLVRQTFLVRADSQLRSIADIDRAAVKLGATRNDSIALYLRRTLEQAQLVELDDSSRDTVHRMLREGTLDAFGANRQRLTDMQQGAADLRLLPDDLYGVEQTIIVPSGRREALDRVNRFIDDVRASGFLQRSIDRSGVVGIAVAPAR
jgi:polar amino acid transport system substrate-binding protein